MNNRIWTILMAIGLIACFFLPAFAGISAYEYVFKSPGGHGNWEKYVWLAFPVSGLILLIGAINNGHYFLRSFWAWLPLIAIIIIIVRTGVGPDWKFDSKVFIEVLKAFQPGFWAMTAISLLLAFINPRR